MAKLVVVEQLSLDGVMQGPGGPDEDRSGGFEHGGWAMPYFDEVAGEEAGKSMAETAAFLFGRKTYEIMAAYWPNHPDNDIFSNVLNSLPKYVASTTLDEPLAWSGSSLLKGDVAEAVAALKEEARREHRGAGQRSIGSDTHGARSRRRVRIDDPPADCSVPASASSRGSAAMRPLRLVDSRTSTTGVILATYRSDPD